MSLRFDNIEKIPALLHESILKLQEEQDDGGEQDSQNILSWRTEGCKISMLVGTALDPPKIKTEVLEVIIAECEKSDEVRLHVVVSYELSVP